MKYRIKLACRLQERSHIQRGAEGANSERIGTKLSGKRTVAYLNPGKIQALSLDTDGEKSRACRGIISQVKKTGGRRNE